MSHLIPLPASNHDIHASSSSSRPSTPPWPASSRSPTKITSTSPRANTFPSKAKHHITHRLHHHNQDQHQRKHQHQNSDSSQHHSHHYYRPHYHHHHQRDKSVPHSAVSIPASLHAFGETLTKMGSSFKSGIEEGKTVDKEGERDGEEGEEELEMKRGRKRKLMGEGKMWKEVERKREEGKKAQEGLHQKLHSLTTLSTNTTRRFDYTYYSLLSHLSTLTTLATQLSDLSQISTSLLNSFSAKSSFILSTSSAQIHTFDRRVNGQVARIAELEQRLNQGRQIVAELGARLDLVRGKVQREEGKEREGEKKVQMRLKILWAVLALGAALFLVLGVVRCWPGRREDMAGGFPVLNSSVVVPSSTRSTEEEEVNVGVDVEKERDDHSCPKMASLPSFPSLSCPSIPTVPSPLIRHLQHDNDQNRQPDSEPSSSSDLSSSTITSEDMSSRTRTIEGHQGWDVLRLLEEV